MVDLLPKGSIWLSIVNRAINHLNTKKTTKNSQHFIYVNFPVQYKKVLKKKLFLFISFLIFVVVVFIRYKLQNHRPVLDKINVTFSFCSGVEPPFFIVKYIFLIL